MNIKITLSIVGVTELITHAFKHTTMLESLLQPLREHLPQDRIWQTLLTTPCLGGMLMLPLLFSGNATASVRGYLSGPLFVRILNRVPRLSPRGLSLLFAALGILILQFAVGRLLPDLYRGKIDPAIQFALMALFIARFGCFNMPRSQETVTVSEPVRLLPFDDDTCGVILLPEQGRVMLFRTGKMPSLHNGERTVYKRPDERAMGFLCDSSVPLQFRNGIELSRFLEVQLEASLFVTPLKQKIDMKEIGDEPVSYAQLQDSIHQLAQESVAPLLLMHPEVAALNAELVAMNARIAPDQDEMVDLDLPTLTATLKAQGRRLQTVKAVLDGTRVSGTGDGESTTKEWTRFPLLGGLFHVCFTVAELDITPAQSESQERVRRRCKRATLVVVDGQHLPQNSATAEPELPEELTDVSARWEALLETLSPESHPLDEAALFENIPAFPTRTPILHATSFGQIPCSVWGRLPPRPRLQEGQELKSV